MSKRVVCARWRSVSEFVVGLGTPHPSFGAWRCWPSRGCQRLSLDVVRCCWMLCFCRWLLLAAVGHRHLNIIHLRCRGGHFHLHPLVNHVPLAWVGSGCCWLSQDVIGASARLPQNIASYNNLSAPIMSIKPLTLEYPTTESRMECAAATLKVSTWSSTYTMNLRWVVRRRARGGTLKLIFTCRWVLLEVCTLGQGPTHSTLQHGTRWNPHATDSDSCELEDRVVAWELEYCILQQRNFCFCLSM